MADAIGPDEYRCTVCESLLVDPGELRGRERSAFEFMEWMGQVFSDGKWGPSPGGACGRLKCSRAMIDKLAAAGVLERSEYKDKYGHHVIMISDRSIEHAKKHKKRTGRWMPIDGREVEEG